MNGYRAKWIKGHDKRLYRDGPNPDPEGRCMCGCGQLAPIARCTDINNGSVAGKPQRYILGHCGRPPLPLIDPETGCWVWQGAGGGRDRDRPMLARGNSKKPGAKRLAYRDYYERLRGAIPEGHDLHHTCENPMCVNPDHLEPLTPTEHKQRHKKAA